MAMVAVALAAVDAAEVVGLVEADVLASSVEVTVAVEAVVSEDGEVIVDSVV